MKPTIVQGNLENGPFREVRDARHWLEVKGFSRDGKRPCWKWEDAFGNRARLRYRAQFGFYWEFRGAIEQLLEPLT